MKKLHSLLLVIFVILLQSCGQKNDAEVVNIRFPQINTDQQLTCIEKGSKEALEIVSWNIEHFPKNGDYTLNKVKETILEMEMDLIAVQEISKAKQFDYLLTQLNNYHGVYGENKYIRLGFIYNTNQLEVVTPAKELFKTQTVEFPRSPLVMKFKHKESGEEFTAINIHLKCCSDPKNVKRRKDAMRILKNYIDTELSGESVVLLGDFNQPIKTSDEYKNIYYQFQLDPNYIMTTDFLLGNSDRWSYPKWPSHLDQIIISGHFLNGRQVTDTMTIDKCDQTYIKRISDHRPVFIKLNDL